MTQCGRQARQLARQMARNSGHCHNDHLHGLRQGRGCANPNVYQQQISRNVPYQPPQQYERPVCNNNVQLKASGVTFSAEKFQSTKNRDGSTTFTYDLSGQAKIGDILHYKVTGANGVTKDSAVFLKQAGGAGLQNYSSKNGMQVNTRDVGDRTVVEITLEAGISAEIRIGGQTRSLGGVDVSLGQKSPILPSRTKQTEPEAAAAPQNPAPLEAPPPPGDTELDNDRPSEPPFPEPADSLEAETTEPASIESAPEASHLQEAEEEEEEEEEEENVGNTTPTENPAATTSPIAAASPVAPPFTRSIKDRVDSLGKLARAKESYIRHEVLEDSAQLDVMDQLHGLNEDGLKRLSEAYKEKHNRELLKDCKNHLSAGRAAAANALLVEYNPITLAQFVYENMHATFDNEPIAVIDLLTNLPLAKRLEVADEYKRTHDRAILTELGEVSTWIPGGARSNVSLLTPFLDETEHPGLRQAANLYRLMDGIGKNHEDLIIKNLKEGPAGPAQVNDAFNTFYKTIWGTDLRATLEDELVDKRDEALKLLSQDTSTSTEPTSTKENDADVDSSSSGTETASRSIEERVKALSDLGTAKEPSWYNIVGNELGLPVQLKIMHELADLDDNGVAALGSAYQKKYKRALLTDVNNHLSPGRAEALRAKLSGFDADKAAHFIESNIGANFLDDPMAPIDLVSNLPLNQRMEVLKKYQEKHKKSMIDVYTHDYTWRPGGADKNLKLLTPFTLETEPSGLRAAADLCMLFGESKKLNVKLNVEDITNILERGSESPSDIMTTYNKHFTEIQGDLLKVLEKGLSKESFKKVRDILPEATTE
jgi:hypothetical protein